MSEPTADIPLPTRDAVSAAYWDALAEGELRFPRCPCGHAWLPPSRECPRCLASDWTWETASGAARLVSWVVYHHAFHPTFAARLPYVVAVIELVEGPRLISGLAAGSDHASLGIDQPMRLAIEPDFGLHLPRFAPA